MFPLVKDVLILPSALVYCGILIVWFLALLVLTITSCGKPVAEIPPSSM